MKGFSLGFYFVFVVVLECGVLQQFLKRIRCHKFYVYYLDDQKIESKIYTYTT